MSLMRKQVKVGKSEKKTSISVITQETQQQIGRERLHYVKIQQAAIPTTHRERTQRSEG